MSHLRHHRKGGLEAHTCAPSTGLVEMEGWGIPGQPWLHTEFETSLGYIHEILSHTTATKGREISGQCGNCPEDSHAVTRRDCKRLSSPDIVQAELFPVIRTQIVFLVSRALIDKEKNRQTPSPHKKAEKQNSSQ